MNNFDAKSLLGNKFPPGQIIITTKIGKFVGIPVAFGPPHVVQKKFPAAALAIKWATYQTRGNHDFGHDDILLLQGGNDTGWTWDVFTETILNESVISIWRKPEAFEIEEV